MRKSGIILFVFLVQLNIVAQSHIYPTIENDTLIYWDSKRKLTWEDFQGTISNTKTTKGMLATAVTSAYLLLEYT